MFTLGIKDKGGRGELMALIDRLAKDLMKHRHDADKHEFNCLARQLDQARSKFHKLYGYKPQQGETNGSEN